MHATLRTARGKLTRQGLLGGMSPGALWQHGHQRNDRKTKDERCNWPAQGKAAMVKRLVEKISDGGAKGASENERRPKQRRAICAGEEVERGKNRETCSEHARGAEIAQTARVSEPVAERRA